MLTPKEIEMKEFTRTKVGGYKQEEVDEFLDRITADYESLLEERDALNKRVAYLSEKLDRAREDQDKIKTSVVTNQKSYDDMMGSAKRKADKLVYDAQDYARRLIETAKEEADRQQQVKSQLTAEVESFKSKLLSIYENHVKLISTIPTIKRDDDTYSSGALEMLKVATADAVPSYEIQEEPQVEEPAEEEADITRVMPRVRAVEPVEEPEPEYKPTEITPRSRRAVHVYDEDNDDDEEIEDKSENDSQIKGLFSNEKKKKSLFGGKKKQSLFKKDDDDDEDDDDDDDDDD